MKATLLISTIHALTTCQNYLSVSLETAEQPKLIPGTLEFTLAAQRLSFNKSVKRKYCLKLWIQVHGLPLNPGEWTLSLENTKWKFVELDALRFL